LEVMAKAIIEGQSGSQSSEIAFEDEDAEMTLKEEIAKSIESVEPKDSIESADPVESVDVSKDTALESDSKEDQW